MEAGSGEDEIDARENPEVRKNALRIAGVATPDSRGFGRL